MSRSLYLVAYDICDPQRRTRVCRYLKSYRVQGQKSVPEIWVTPAELQHIQRHLADLLQPHTDRIQIVALDPRMKPHCLGKAATFNQHHFCIV